MTYRWSSSNEADRVPVEDPATGEVIAVVQGGGPDEDDTAVEAAHRAFETDWRWRTWAERATLLLRGADVLEQHADELALLELRENRKPVQDARQNHITFLIALFRFPHLSSRARIIVTLLGRMGRKPTSELDIRNRRYRSRPA